MTKTLVVASVPRSGSNLLCDLLRTNGLGWIEEDFNHLPSVSAFGQAIAERVSTEAFLEGVRSHPKRAEDAWFGTKLHPNFFGLMRANLARCAATDREMLERLFPDARYVFLRRRDRIAQTISLARAKKSGQFFRMRSGESAQNQEPQTFRTGIFDLHTEMTNLVQWEDDWRVYFRETKVAPLEIWYEDFVADQPGHLKAIFDFLGEASPDEWQLDTDYVKQRDAATEEIRQQYERILGQNWLGTPFSEMDLGGEAGESSVRADGNEA